MTYIKEDKSKGIEESYTPDWIEQIKVEEFKPEEIPWINHVWMLIIVGFLLKSTLIMMGLHLEVSSACDKRFSYV